MVSLSLTSVISQSITNAMFKTIDILYVFVSSFYDLYFYILMISILVINI